MNERIKELRKREKLSQKDFGEKLGASRDVIANIENGRVDPTKTMIQLICLEFNVNETWLHTGEGEMFGTPGSTNRLSSGLKLDDMEKSIVEQYLRLSKENRAAVKAVMWGIVDAMPKRHKDRIEAELASYRVELEAEEKGMDALSVSGNTKDA